MSSCRIAERAAGNLDRAGRPGARGRQVFGDRAQSAKPSERTSAKVASTGELRRL